jgi:hypothetical protein
MSEVLAACLDKGMSLAFQILFAATRQDAKTLRKQ